MTPERFQQIEELYHVARERPTEERAALLAAADPEVRREVESLLAQRSGGELLERPAMQNAPRLMQDSTVSNLAAGAMLGPYRIESRLGEGGMGEVYRAVDTRLGRAVAIKITHEQFSDRFEREARAISALNHPHICTLYDVGSNYLVMELVEGETIAARLKSGALQIKTALLYASQIVAALVEAHEKGIIHRDLKPGNVMIAKCGIKVLDFGLAKSKQDDTVTASHLVMGTPGYMAPEQREGRPADARSDIYSFGCVLYEMLIGTRVAFQRRRISSRKLERLVSRCLEEDPVRRWQSAAEVEQELSHLLATVKHGKRDATAVTVPAYSQHSLTHRDKNTIVLAEFANATGDPSFNGTLRQILAGELEKSPHLSVLSDTRVNETLRLMARDPVAQLTVDLASEICERTASAAVVEGSITSLGSKYVLSLRAKNYQTGDILDQEQRSAAKKEDVFKVLAQMANRLRTRVGESLPSMKRAQSTSTEVSTPSLEAWRFYNAAMRAIQAKAAGVEGTSLLRRAIEIDPNFAMAYALMGRIYDGLGESELGAQSIAKAYDLRHRVSDRENFFITFNYYRQAPRNLELARQILESWVHKYPGDTMPHWFLSGLTSPGTSHHDRAAEEGQKAIELNPDFARPYYNAAFAYLYLNRLSEAEALLCKASERKIEDSDLSICRYFIAFLKNDQTAMQREIAQRKAKLEAQGWFEHQEALTFAFQGRLQEANRLSDRAVSLARQAGLPERAAMFAGARAVWNALYGIRAQAQTDAEGALSLFRGRDADYGPAFALALLGDCGVQTEKIAADLEKRYPEDTCVIFSYLPTLRALDALNEGDAARALEMTQAAAPYDLAVPGTAYLAAFFGALYPVFVRGLAYSRLKRPSKAAAEFQKILDHPGIVLNDPIGPMARLQLARALSVSGDLAKSAAVYNDLLTLWKDADPDLPILKEANTEYAKLKYSPESK